MYINAHRNWNAEIETAFSPLLRGREREFSGAQYSKGKKKHLVMMQVAKEQSDTEPDSSILFAGMFYNAANEVESLRVPKAEQREAELMYYIISIDQKWSIDCNVEFKLSEVDESALWFPLPSRIGGTKDSSETFLITGVQAEKLRSNNDSAQEYNFFLTRSSEAEVFLDLYFPYEGEFSPELPSHVLSKGVSIAERLIGRVS
jgi:hypothetical protein